MEPEELQLLLKIRKGIMAQSWEQVIAAWNEISGEALEVPDDRSPADKLKDQLKEALKEDAPSKPSGPIDPDTMEESIKDQDIVKINAATDDNKEKKNRRTDVKKRVSGIPEDMKVGSEKAKDKPARFYDEIPDHIARGSDD